MRLQTAIIIIIGVLCAACLTGACGNTNPPPGTPTGGNSSSGDRGPRPPAPPPAPPGSATCDHAKAQWAIGEPAGDDLLERARVSAGAATARFLRPNQRVTLEYLGSRLNLGLDEHDIVKTVVCG